MTRSSIALTFVVPSTRHPSGGVAISFELASEMAKRGHTVHLYHAEFFQANVTRIEDIGWFSFPDNIIHHFLPPGVVDFEAMADADVFFGYVSEPEMPGHIGLPVVLIQGFKMLGKVREFAAFRAPCPKVCVASWLVDVGLDLGVPARQLVHIPLGLRHDKYNIQKPVSGRPPRVSFCYRAHPQKGAQLALDVLRQVRRTVNEVELTVFGAVRPEHELPAWATYRTDPTQRELVEDIYNNSRVFLCTSKVEGFGLTAIEAMACGAALVTTDNGGSRDYAHHDHTALVAPTGDVDRLAAHVTSLLEDDDRCSRLAVAGRDYVDRFDWERSAEILELFLDGYLADPVAHGRPVGGLR